MSEEWAKIQNDFETQVPEPDEVIFYEYGGGSYDGDALLVYRKGKNYFWVEGSHCSCHGLEGQFNPEVYDKTTLIEALDRKIATSEYDTSYPSMDKGAFEKILSKIAA